MYVSVKKSTLVCSVGQLGLGTLELVSLQPVSGSTLQSSQYVETVNVG